VALHDVVALVPTVVEDTQGLEPFQVLEGPLREVEGLFQEVEGLCQEVEGLCQEVDGAF